MDGRTTYPRWLEGELGSLIDDLELEPRQKRVLRSRWLEQVLWLERKARRARNFYYGLRLTTVIGALLVPALVTISVSDDTLDAWVKAATWVVSLVVAISAAVTQFFHFGERWRSYRRTAERLKAEGWLYFQLGGHYAANGASHESVFPAFAARTEKLILEDVDSFLTDVTVEREVGQERGRGR